MTAQRELTRTESLCPVCLRKLEAAVVCRDDRVYLEKICPEHGAFCRLLWQGEADYLAWLDKGGQSGACPWEQPVLAGCPYDCGICSDHAQDACCVLLELTQRCDQHCPYCYAAAGEGGACGGEPTLAQVTETLAYLRQRSSGQPYNIQLSGGEPTLRQDLPQIIACGRAQGFVYVQLNTNGRRLALQPGYAAQLAEAGLSAVFLQFDAMDDRIYRSLRGEALLEQKLLAIERCREAGLPVILVMTLVKEMNMAQIGSCLRLLLANLPYLRGLHLQPVCYTGRHPGLAEGPTLQETLTALVDGSGGLLRREDFAPLATGHPLCSFQGNFLYDGQQVISVGGGGSCCGVGEIDRSRRKLAGNWGGGGAPAWLGAPGVQGFSVSAMAFQDGLSLDLARLRRCRVYVAATGRRLIPFCAYQLTSCRGQRLYSRG